MYVRHAHKFHVAVEAEYCAIEPAESSDMSSKKRGAASSISATTVSKKPKRQVTIVTFNKWKTQFEREHQTLSWLRCDPDGEDKERVATLWCQACRTHERSITSMKNFSRAWIVVRPTKKQAILLTYATCEQHRCAMSRVHADAAKASSLPITSYSPIARSLLVMDDTTRDRMRKKFDTMYKLCYS